LQLTSYRADLVRLEAEAAELDIKRDELRKQMEQTKRVIASLASLAGEHGINAGEMGFTDACRTMLNNAHPEWISAIEIREALVRSGFDLSGYANAMASIHTILRRLEENNEVEKKEEGLKTVFRRKPKLVCMGVSITYGPPKNEAVIAKAAGIHEVFNERKRRIRIRRRRNTLLEGKNKK